MRHYFRKLCYAVKAGLNRLSFKTGVAVLCMCVPFYILSFAQMALNISGSLKATLWVLFFGLAKTFQYAGLAILGAEGMKRLKKWWIKVRGGNVTDTKS